MARKPTFGTPHQSKVYSIPDSRRGRFLACWAGVGIVALAVLADALTTKRFLVSPGALSKSHTIARSQDPNSGDCARCHTPFSAPADALCVGCHEPRTSVSRFTNQAHSEQIQAADRGTTGAKHPAHPPACSTCHAEHLGREARISHVGNQYCGSCHGFRTFGSRHPEFGILRLQRAESPGIKFPHKRHLEELAKKNVQPPHACETCHHPNPGRTEFASITFDRDCSPCHFREKGTIGETSPLPTEMVVTIEAISASDPAASWAREYTDHFGRVRDRLVKKTILHRDAWILYNTTRLAAAIEGAPSAAGSARPPEAGIDAKVAALRAELGEVERSRSEAASAQSTDAVKRRLSDSEARISRLTAEVADLDLKVAQAAPDTTPAQAPAPASDQIRAALAEIDAVLSLLSSRREGWAHDEGEALRAKRAQLAARADQTGPGWSAAGLAARRAEMARRLDDLAGAGAPASHLAALRQETERLSSPASAPASSAAETVPAVGLQPSLGEIDADLDLLASRGEPWAREEAERLRVRRDGLASRIDHLSPAWTQDSLQRRRAEVAGLIDDLSRTGAPPAQVAALKRELESAPSSAPRPPGVASLRAARDSKAAALASAKQEAERLKEILRTPDGNPAANAAELDLRRSQIEGEIQALEALSRAPTASSSGTVLDPEEAARTIGKMIKPCTKCHLEANHSIGKTAAARSALPASAFNHKPHIQEAGCLECHGKIVASEDAADFSLDGVAKCRSCHKWSGSSNTCQTCHRYHPAPPEATVALLDPSAPGGGPS